MKRPKECAGCSLNPDSPNFVGFHRVGDYVPPFGDPQSKWAIVAIVPGGEEERRGEPLVGPAGRILNTVLRCEGIDPASAHKRNIVNCRTIQAGKTGPINRIPTIHEQRECASRYLLPWWESYEGVVLVLGEDAWKFLLEPKYGEFGYAQGNRIRV